MAEITALKGLMPMDYLEINQKYYKVIKAKPTGLILSEPFSAGEKATGKTYRQFSKDINFWRIIPADSKEVQRLEAK